MVIVPESEKRQDVSPTRRTDSPRSAGEKPDTTIERVGGGGMGWGRVGGGGVCGHALFRFDHCCLRATSLDDGV